MARMRADDGELATGDTTPSTSQHSYPPTVTAPVVTAGAGAGSNGGESSISSNNANPGLVRPPTRASSYATANESDEEDPMDGGATPRRPRSLAASPTALDSAAAADTRDGDEASDNVHEEEEEEDNVEHDSIPPATPTGTMTPAAQLRLSLARRLWSGVTQLRSRSRCALLFQGAFTIAQIATFVVMLALSARQTCEKPLRVFIALHIIRVAIAYPVSFYNALAPPGRPPRGEEDTPESRERREARRVVGNRRLDSRLRSASDLISLFSFVWFFLGNVWLYSGGQCRDTSPYMWWSTLTILIIAYIRIAELAIIILAVVFFLPLVIIVLRAFGGLEKKHEIGPLTKEEIAKLPTVYYIPAPETTEKSQGAAPTGGEHVEKQSDSRTENTSTLPNTVASASQSPENSSSSKPRRRHLLRILFKRKRRSASDASPKNAAKGAFNGLYVPTKYPLHPLPDNLSSCPICLSDYEPPPSANSSPEERDKALKELEPLSLLPCGHTIHKDCLAPWLHTSGRCPVCQRAVLGDEDGMQKKGRLRRMRRNRRLRREANSENEDVERGPVEEEQEQDQSPTPTNLPPLPSRQ